MFTTKINGEATGRSTRRRTVLRATPVLSLIAASVAMLLAVSGSSAFASQRYYATGDGLALRSGPGTQFALVGRVNQGAALDIVCQQQGGSNVGGNATWDKLTNGQWVADYFTTTPSFNSYAPGLGACVAPAEPAPTPVPAAPTPAAPAPGVTAAAQDAVNRARSQIGSTAWEWMCDKLAAYTYHFAASGEFTAYGHWNDISPSLRHPGDTNVPPGGLAFFGPAAVNGSAGHVMISVGNGQFVSNGIAGKVGITTIGTQARYAPYLGWAPGVFPKGSGRV